MLTRKRTKPKWWRQDLPWMTWFPNPRTLPIRIKPPAGDGEVPYWVRTGRIPKDIDYLTEYVKKRRYFPEVLKDIAENEGADLFHIAYGPSFRWATTAGRKGCTPDAFVRIALELYKKGLVIIFGSRAGGRVYLTPIGKKVLHKLHIKWRRPQFIPPP